jgi:hypothetical protein
MSEKQPAEVVTKIRNVLVQKLDQKADCNTHVIFDFGANLEETERSADTSSLSYKINMNTEPSIAKFEVEGTASVTGDEATIEKMLSSDPETDVPYVFTRIYQAIYPVIFMLAGTTDVPYPSPALLKRAQVKSAFATPTEIPQTRS